MATHARDATMRSIYGQAPLVIAFDVDPHGMWTARIELTGIEATGPTRHDALRAALDLFWANEAAQDPPYMTMDEALAMQEAVDELERGEMVSFEEVGAELGLDAADIRARADGTEPL